MRRLAFRILTPLVAVLVLVMAAEAVMRAAAPLFWGRPNLSDPVPVSSTNEFRIIAIGESTTASVMVNGQDTAWPGQLERILNQAGLGRTFKVFNLALPATSTPFLLTELKTQLPVIRPNLVVSMMGINDDMAYQFLHESSWWSSLRVVKLARWIWGSFHSSADSYPPKPDGKTAEALREFADRLDSTLAGRDLDKARQMAAEAAAKYPSQLWLVDKMTAFHLMHAAFVVRPRLDHPNGDQELSNRATDLALHYLRESFVLNPLDPVVLSRIEFIYLARHRPDLARQFVELGVSRGVEMDGPSLTMLPSLFGPQDPLVKRVLAKQGIGLVAQRTLYTSTVECYRRIAALLKASHVGYIAMQYPTGKMGPLREIFSDRSAQEIGRRRTYGEAMYEDVPDAAVSPEYGHVLFASNENFNDVVNASNEGKYFRDKFAPPFHRFGHTTTLGYELIARNLAKVIVANWDELKGYEKNIPK